MSQLAETSIGESQISEVLINQVNRLAVDQPMAIYGHVSRYDGQMIECNGFPANIGALCKVETDDDIGAVAEVIGFHHGNNLLSFMILVRVSGLVQELHYMMRVRQFPLVMVFSAG